jgi:hypothetical protein
MRFRSSGAVAGHASARAIAPTVGKQTLVEQIADAPAAPAPVQRKLAADPDAANLAPDRVREIAAAGTRGPGGALPHLGTIQRLFGRHDVTGVRAHVDDAAAASAGAIGARAYATGDHVAFAGAPGLHTAAHEAAHVVQQRGGVQLKAAVGQAGDDHERHADEVADRVVAGASAEDLLDRYAATGATSLAVQLQVDPGLPPGTKVTVIDDGARGVISREFKGNGYRVYTQGEEDGLRDLEYNQLDRRNNAPAPVQKCTKFKRLNDIPSSWWQNEFPSGFGAQYGKGTSWSDRRHIPKLIAQSPVARGDMHDIRAVLSMDPDVRVLITAFDDDTTFKNDVDTIVGYYQGIPNFRDRVATIAVTPDLIRPELGALFASDSTRVLHWLRDNRENFGSELRIATAGVDNNDDEFDCRAELVRRGFDKTSSYVLVNFRDSGHNPGEGRPQSHPEHDSGAQGYWDLMRTVLQRGYVPVPMGSTPGLESDWPGPSLVDYFKWPSCTSQNRNKRQGEYFLLRALFRFNPNVRALAWRSGVTDAISFVGIPVIALDVKGSDGHTRARTREGLLPNRRYKQLDLSNRSGDESEGLVGWIGGLTDKDQHAVGESLGEGPRSGLVKRLTDGTRGATRAFIDAIVALVSDHDAKRVIAAFGTLAKDKQRQIATGMKYARLLATSDLMTALHTYTGATDDVDNRETRIEALRSVDQFIDRVAQPLEKDEDFLFRDLAGLIGELRSLC